LLGRILARVKPRNQVSQQGELPIAERQRSRVLTRLKSKHPDVDIELLDPPARTKDYIKRDLRDRSSPGGLLLI
jgi:hypothetical protein